MKLAWRMLMWTGVVGQVLTGLASAQTAGSSSSSTLEEVVVTAERRAEKLQDVPISVSAYNQAAMDAQGMRAIDDISRLTPGVNFVHGTNFNSESSNISIRGIDSNAGAATTGVYIDDTPIQSRHLSFGTFNAWPALFDIDRVEVLRGPQGTLFGAGSEGGTVRFITPEPSLKGESMYARADIASTAHGDPIYEAGVAGGMPLVEDTLGLRASFSYRREGGYVDRVDPNTGATVDPKSNWNHTLTGRVALKWRATADLSLTPSVYWQQRYVNDTAAYWNPQPGATPLPPTDVFSSPFKNGNSVQNNSHDTFWLPALKIDWNLGAVRLLSNTSYFKRTESAVTDYTQFDRAVFTGDPYPPTSTPAFPPRAAPTYWADDQENFTQEIRFESTDPNARIQWIAGVFYQHNNENTIENVYDPNLPSDFDAFTGVPGLWNSIFGPTINGYIYLQDPYKAIDKQLAVFGQVDFGITDQLKLTLGLRYAKFDTDGQAYYAGPVVGPPVSSTGSLSEHPLTPKISLNYQIDHDNLLYATAAKGFRPGGFNPEIGLPCGPSLAALGLSDVPHSYSSDSVWSYELGTKNTFADRRVLLNASVYDIRWKDIQQNVYLSACGFQFVGNLGTAESKGFDLQTQVKAADWLTLGLTFGYTDARYTETVLLQGATASIVQDGNHLPGSPWTLGAFGQLNFPVADKEGYVRLDYQYGAQQTDKVPNQDPANGTYAKWYASVPVQSYAQLRAGLRFSGLDLSIYGQNLFDTRPRLTANQDVGTPAGGSPLFYDITWRPRTIGLTAIYHY